MPRPKPFLIAGALVAVVAITACGSQTINADNQQPQSPVHQGAVLFNERCGGCHTLKAAATNGSNPASQVAHKERTDGPNLDFRKESVQDVLFAIRNGGFSGSIMPANVVVGAEAQAVAEFVSKYAGGKSTAAK